MNGKSQLTLSLTNDAIAVLEKNTTERKRGEFISNLLVTYGAQEGAISQIDIESIKLQLLGLASQIKQLDGRLLKVERNIVSKGQ
ncbi:MAG: hypothetical protein U0350_05965 [Caldilineaceae bacterium]